MMSSRFGPSHRSSAMLRLSLLVLGFALAAPGGALGATRPAQPSPFATSATAPGGDFSINLYRKGDFVSQAKTCLDDVWRLQQHTDCPTALGVIQLENPGLVQCGKLNNVRSG